MVVITSQVTTKSHNLITQSQSHILICSKFQSCSFPQIGSLVRFCSPIFFLSFILILILIPNGLSLLLHLATWCFNGFMDSGKLGMGSEKRNMCENKIVANGGGDDVNDEIKALLSKSRSGVGVRSDDDGKKSMMRKVQWNDEKGNKLVEVVEFEPSEASDSDSEDSFDSCLCFVM